MRFKITFAILACASLSLLLACASRPQATITVACADFAQQPNIVAVTKTPLPLGRPFTISLCYDPSAGFQWSESATVSDATVVLQTGHKLVAGQDIWTFDTLTAGHVVLSWNTVQSTGQVPRSFRVSVNVE